MRDLTSSETKYVSGGNPALIGVGIGMIAGGITSAARGGTIGDIFFAAGLGGAISLTAGIAATGYIGSIAFGFMGRLAQGANAIGLTVAAGADDGK